jgi:hypothetical protein
MPDNYPTRERTHNFHGLTFLASVQPAPASRAALTAGQGRVPRGVPVGHLQHEHGDVVVLLVARHHRLDQVVDQLSRVRDDAAGCPPGDGDQFVEPGVQTAPSVLH